jgi:hypothetical protein
MASFRWVIAVCTVPTACLAIWQGCSVYDTSLLLAGDGGDAASDANALPDGGNGCISATWPPRPLADDDASVDNIVFYQAIENLDFGAGDSGVTVIGFNLDNVCTCEGKPPGPDSCITFAEAGTQCDLDGGVDNSAGLLIREFAGSGGNFFDQGYINQGIAEGVFGAIFRVTNYNGTANDTSVEVSIYTSNGTQGAGTDAGPMMPQWNGNDVWTLDPSSLLGGTIGDAGPIPFIAYDLNAYVADWTLVSNISDMPLAIGAATGEGLVTIDLSDAHVIAKLSPFGSTFQAVGTVAGRWESSKLLTSLAVLYDPFQMDASLCGTDPVYQLLKPRICALEDISNTVLNDGMLSAPCDALSLGFNFTSVPATYGAVFAKPDGGGGGCGPQWTDQCGP